MAGVEVNRHTTNRSETSALSVVHESEANQETLEPSSRSKAFMRGAHQEATVFDPEEKQLRDKAKALLTENMIATVGRYGIGEPVKMESKYTGEEYEEKAKSTPIVPYSLSEDEIIGVSLREELAIAPKFINGLFLGEEVVTGKIHLIEHDFETGEQIGRNSAGVLGPDFVTNAAKGSATRQQIEGMNDTVRYIDRYLSSQQGAVPQLMEPGVVIDPRR